MKNDIDIAREASMLSMADVAGKLGLDEKLVIPFGTKAAKVAVDRMDLSRRRGKMVLVTAMSPTPAGEGKTTMAIGLTMALCARGKNAVVGLREPSLGPVFGIKGGAAGGGHSQVLPMEDINLHFTGDMHAVTSAHNLLSALVNNAMHFDNPLCIDSRNITWPRVLDVNDRSLRQMVVGLGGKKGGMVDEGRFDITAASEVMAVLCLASDLMDLKERLNRILVGFSTSGEPVRCSDMKAAGAMTLLLKDAIRPNLVQTIEGTPAIVHGGPFANIAHGTSSLMAARLGLNLADIYVTEAGFGSDLGAEKFFDIFCRTSGLPVAGVVLVATTRALKYHGGVKKKLVRKPNAEALVKGFVNLRGHVENIRGFGFEPVVGLNVMEGDDPAELELVVKHCEEMGVECVPTRIHEKGSDGGLELADAVLASMDEKTPKFRYPLDMGIREKIEMLAKDVYGARSITLAPEAKKQVRRWEELGYRELPLCVAKTQYSFSDDKKLLGRPTGFRFHVREVRLSAGAGYLVPLAGDMMTMPGLPRHPASERMDLTDECEVVGLF